jgi:hypothetical protein
MCRSLPRDARSGVHIFLIHGIDPGSEGKLLDVRDYLHSLNFFKTYTAASCRTSWVTEQMLKVREENPQARFVLIGYDPGTQAVDKLAQHCVANEYPLDVILYLQPTGWEPKTEDDLPTVPRKIAILGESSDKQREALPGIEQVVISDISGRNVPYHEITHRYLATELAEIARKVPVSIAAEPEVLPLVDPAPGPRGFVPQPSPTPDDWDFLKPVSRKMSTQPAERTPLTNKE